MQDEHLKNGLRQTTRTLKQQAEPAPPKEITVVTSPEQLLNALDQEVLHIQIQEHLDLTAVQPRNNGEPNIMLNDEVTAAKNLSLSIQVC